MAEATTNVSHGRGGQGNIGPDETQYVDGEIRREGDPTAAGGAYSAGRGGAGNIGSPKADPVNTGNDNDVVPEQAQVPAEDQYHEGRGGQGNIKTTTATDEAKKNGIIHKVKRKLRSLLKKKQ